MKEKLVIGLVILVALVVIAGTTYGVFYLKRNINYSLFYEEKVKEQVAPLELRIDTLEKRIEDLEKK